MYLRIVEKILQFIHFIRNEKWFDRNSVHRMRVASHIIVSYVMKSADSAHAEKE